MDKKHFLGFLVAEVIAIVCIMHLMPPSPCQCGGVPAGQELSRMFNGRSSTHGGPKLDRADDQRLLELLGTASMEDKTVIVTFTNEAFAAPGSLMDLFLESFRTGVKTEALLKHLLIIAVDAKAYERCRQVHPLCYYYSLAVSNGTDFSSEQPYMAKDYLDMMWRRNRFQARILELGFNFVFADVDIVWFRNPLLRIPVGADIAMSSDVFYGDNPYDLDKNANGGFLYVKSRPRTIAFYGDWYQARAVDPGENEQLLFDRVKHELAARHGVVVQFVDTVYLAGFCQPTNDFYKACRFHGNCIRGLQTKLDRLRRVLNDWKQFRANNTELVD